MKFATWKWGVALVTLAAVLLGTAPSAFATGRAIELRTNWVGQHATQAAPSLELITEHSAGQHVAQGRVLASPVVVTRTAQSFSWRDAGFGAAMALVAVLIVATALTLQRRSRLAATNG